MSFFGGNPTQPFGHLFGQQTTPQPSSTLNNVFGGATTVGTTPPSQNNSGFGNLFSSGNSSNVFGGASNVFGNASNTTPAANSSFDTTGKQSQAAGTSIPYNPLLDKDCATTNGVTTQLQVIFTNITCMDCYKNKSVEELRLEDYQLQRHKKGALFSGSSITNTTPAPASNSIFGSTTAPATNPGTGLFGQLTNTLGSGGGSALFPGTSAPFSFNNSSFTRPTTTIGTSSTQPFAFSFGQQQSTTSAAFGSTGGVAGSGTSNLFSGIQQQQPASQLGIQQQQPASQLGIQQQQPAYQPGIGFLNKSTNAAATTPGLTSFGSFTGGGNTAFGTTPAAKPAFGGTATNLGSGFAAPATVGTPGVTSFGSSGTAATGSIFGGITQQTPPQQLTVGNNPIKTAPASSNTAAVAPPPTANIFGSFNNSATTSAPLGGVQQPQPCFTFGAANVPSAGGNFCTPSTSFSFPPVAAAGVPGVSRLIPGQVSIPHCHHLTPPELITFGTSPFKDHPFLYNLQPNFKIPKTEKNTSALELSLMQSSQRMRALHESTSISNGSISSCPAVRKLTTVNRNTNSSISKAAVFDGFEEDDWGLGINILAPKTTVKKLNLKKTQESFLSATSTEDSSSDLESSSLTQNQPEGRLQKGALKKDFTESEENSSFFLRNRRVSFKIPTESVSVQVQEDSLTGRAISSPRRGSCQSEASQTVSPLRSRLRHKCPGEEEEGFRNEEDRGCARNGGTIPGALCGVVNTREGYYLKPSLEELDLEYATEGNCLVMGLELGRRNFGSIKFLEAVNVVNVNIDKLVHFRHKEVVVYPDDENKPPLGEGLNVPAEIQLERVWPLNTETHEMVRNPNDERFKGYETRLRRACDRMGVEFISYNGDEGIWKFRVSHF